MSLDNVNAAKDQKTPDTEPEEQLPDNMHTQEQLQPEVAAVEKPMIVWRSLMLEQ
ncbi:hypothetical protein ACIQVE_10060 [Pseudomonas sp. NPDC098747]|uniref:hypothetical protein n=1 Tax=Pseudomonas sp. NPDC098747 TaxID=3364487 RepID=UPI00383A442F